MSAVPGLSARGLRFALLTSALRVCIATRSVHLTAAESACHGCSNLTDERVFRDCRLLHLVGVLPKSLLASYRNAVSAYFESLPRDEFDNLIQTGRTSNGEHFSRHEIDRGRWEVLLPKDPFLQPALLMQPDIVRVLEETLGTGYVLHSLGSAIAEPGAPAQRWHTDHGYLLGDDSQRLHGLAGHDLPSHAVTMLVPLRDLTHADGFTQMCAGSSHVAGMQERAKRRSSPRERQRPYRPAATNVSTGHSLRERQHEAAMHASTRRALFDDLVSGGATQCPAPCVRTLTPALGDAVLFDYNLMHRGGPNLSDRRRDLLYVTFSRPWFKDHNFLDKLAAKSRRGSARLARAEEVARLTATARFALDEMPPPPPPPLPSPLPSSPFPIRSGGSADSPGRHGDLDSAYARAAMQLRSAAIEEAPDAEADSCVDTGPWLCLEVGCPQPLLSCAALATFQGACSATFADVWVYPPPELNDPRASISRLCARSCTRCDVCPRADGVCEPRLCWAVLKHTVLSHGGPALRSRESRHWLFDTISPLRGVYSDGFDVEVVGAPDAAANVSQKHAMRNGEACLVDRCAAPLAACAASERCRSAWGQLLDRIHSVREIVQLRTDRINASSVRALIECFVPRCLCVAGLASDPAPHVVRFPDAISKEETSAILKLTASIAQNASFVTRRSFGTADGERNVGHSCTYLHSRFATDPLTSAVYERVRRKVVQADTESGWRRVHPPTLVARTIELLNYSTDPISAARWSLGWHVDEQSALTALLLLSDPDEFSGGELNHIVQGKVVSARPRRYEMLVYRSHQPHAVSALRSGQRLTVAIEFWHVRAPGVGSDDPEYAHTRVSVPRQLVRATGLGVTPTVKDSSDESRIACPL